ncbi:MAG: TIGR02171 family protein [Fibrobacter sp.]|nr:TIGR02171 family protein [Fibrobacter sp.]
MCFSLFIGCSNSELYAFAENQSITGNFPVEFNKVSATGKSVKIKDTKQENDSDKELSLIVNFTYDFYIEKHEVTCKEYSVYRKTKSCDNDSLPVTNVTYIDAILFANEKSKDHGLDTAYSYTSVTCDEYNCTKIEGLSFQPNANAYRLPTEAEWVFVAKQGWNTNHSWHAGNAKSTPHPVCSNGQNKISICDMEGNVTEWVNDWLNTIKDTTITNYIGAGTPNALGERVIKGGNYRTAEKSIDSRRDVYTVTSSTTSDYLGFRLAYGQISEAEYFQSELTAADLPTNLTISAATIRKKTGTFKTKIAFRHDISGSLAFVDFSSGDISPLAVIDTINTFHPSISPDGKRVAFCTSPEGVNGQSQVYVRDLNIKGSNLVKLDVENASIPRWKVLDSKDTVIIYVTSAANNKYEPSFMSKSTWMVPFSDGKFGEPKKLFDGAYHGGVADDLKFAVTGSTLLRARTSDSKDTIWYNSEQACNVSLAKDGSKRTLFLDFGGKTGRKFVGKDYDVHEQILIADSTGKLIQAIPAPKGYTFDHTEWVTGNLIATMLTDQEGSHKKIALVDITDSSILEIVKGDELWHPDIWIGEASKTDSPLDQDSASAYWLGNDDELLASKMSAFWAITDSVEIVALGSSRVSLGFTPIALTYGVSFNMATIPNDMDVILYLAENYVFPHCKKLEYLVVSLDLDLWSEEPGINVKRNILSIPGFIYDINHNFWKKENASYIIEASNLRLSEQDYLMGYLRTKGAVKVSEENSWTFNGHNPNVVVGDSVWSDNNIYETALQQFKELLDMAKERDIKVLGVVYPQSPEFAKTGAFGRHGMRRSTATKVLERIANLQSTYPNFIFMDENKMGDHDYPDRLAYDYDHLNVYGGYKITARIDAILWKHGKKEEE